MDERYGSRSQQPLLPLLSIARGQYSPTQAQQWTPGASTSQQADPGVKREGGSPGHHNMDQRAGGGAEDSMSSTSDFVKKLYKMLEDQSFQNVVSWGPQGDCFVVKDMNEFTKSILPRMFKHSNFASFVRQLNKYDFHKVKNTDDNQFGEHSWTFRHPDFHADRRDALENIKRKIPSQRKSTVAGAAAPPPIAMPPPPPSAYPASTSYPAAVPYSPFQLESQNAKIESLQAQLSSLSAAHDEVLSHVRNLERNYQEVLMEMVGFQRGMAQQDGLLQNLIQYFLRENNNGNGNSGKMGSLQQAPTTADGINNNNNNGGGSGNPFLFMQTQEMQRMLDKSFPDTDVARATLVQMSEISRRAEAVGMSFGASRPGSRTTGDASNVGVSGIGTAMGRRDMLARIEELRTQRGRNNSLASGSGSGSNLFGSGNNTTPVAGPSGSNERMEGNRGVDERETPQTESGDSEEYEDEMVLPSTMTYPSPQSGDQAISRIPNLESWDTAGAGHEGLEVYTVGHLMPRGGDGGFMDERSNVFSPEFGGAARFGGSEASGSGSSSNSPPRKQTLRVRRSTFVPGWAVPPRVLLVDDDAVSRKLSSKFLQVFGCTIDVAVDGFGAVNKMNLEKYDLVLMDIVMPKLDGVSATSMIRKFDPQTPIISMTSNSRPNEIMTYYSSGMNDILPKPFTKEGLLDMLEKHLTHLTVIKQKMSTRVPRAPMGVPPLNDAGFEGALQAGVGSAFDRGYGNTDGEGGINVLAGMGLTDEQYNVMLAGIVSGDGFNFGEKRSREQIDEEGGGRDGKRSRFEVIE